MSLARVLGVCGSLRSASLNAALLRTAARLAPRGLEIRAGSSLGALALFNPDLEGSPPAPVRAWREAVAHSDALLLASPEYAHGVSGVVKNALDWLVGFEPFVAKPVAVLNAAPRAHHARDALLETLATMSARIVPGACVTVPLLGSGLSEAQMAESPAVAGPLRLALQELRHALAAGAPPAPAFGVA
ncbi:MAG TPA: NADPH-dependent FMN reductase [Steroidobacteraceae bacterium]|nr:NADPH-dependent FMN reductase [Steroidobacteraceae bacterium]